MKSVELAMKEITVICKEYDREYFGRLVEMTKGKYKGRTARIEGIVPDREYGLVFCCMIQRKDGTGALNSDGWSRSYLPWDWFIPL